MKVNVRSKSDVITDIPTSDDFRQAGVAFLNFAYDAAMEIALAIGDQCKPSERTTRIAKDSQEAKSQKPLATALALGQQGAELLLKAKIARVDPLLILTETPSQLQKDYSTKDRSFADFRTIDSQDLVAVHDEALARPLAPQYRTKYERFRKARNSILHTVDKALLVDIKDVIDAILETYYVLVEAGDWLVQRREYLSQRPDGRTPSNVNEFGRELRLVFDVFSPSFMMRHMAYDKRQRRYRCPNCDAYDICSDRSILVFAQLRPNTPDSLSLYCILCNKTYRVLRKKCPADECQGNVFTDEAEPTCLSCRWRRSQSDISHFTTIKIR